MVIIILLNGIHSELISYCQTAIKQIRLCILTVLKYFQFVLNLRACEKHWCGKWNTNSKGSSSCTGFLFPPPGDLGWRHCRTFWGLDSLSGSSSPADWNLFADGSSSSSSNFPKLNTLLSTSHHYPAPQRMFSLKKTSMKINYFPLPAVPLPPSKAGWHPWPQLGPQQPGQQNQSIKCSIFTTNPLILGPTSPSGWQSFPDLPSPFKLQKHKRSQGRKTGSNMI